MRGLAVLTAVAAAWVLAGGAVPRTISIRPRIRPAVASASLGVGAACGLLTLGLTAVPSVSLAAAALAAAVVPVTTRLRERRRLSEETARWPDFLAALRTELAGGRSLPEAFQAAGHRKGGTFARMASAVAESAARGASFPESLESLQATLADPIGDRVILTLATAHRAGGPRVGTVLAALGSSIADEVRLRGAHDAALTQQRLTATVALIAPWVLLVLTVMTNPTASHAYRTPSGALVVAGGAVATTLGYLLAVRIARLSRPPRVFR